MARISTYSRDTTVNDHDRLIGTDGGRIDTNTGQLVAGTAGATKNFLLSDLRNYFQGSSGPTIRDGDIPRSQAGTLVDSVLSQGEDGGEAIICVGLFDEMDDTVITETANLKVAGDVRLGGNLTNLQGEPIISPGGQNQLAYNTSVSANGSTSIVDINPYTVHVATRARMLRLPQNPTDGMWIKIVQLHQTGRNMLLGFTRIMNTTITGPFILDDITASFEMVWVADNDGTSTDPVGWTIVGAN